MHPPFLHAPDTRSSPVKPTAGLHLVRDRVAAQDTEAQSQALDHELSLPDFWPEGLDPWDNQAVSAWLVSGGWKHYGLDLEDAILRPGSRAWRAKRVMDVGTTLLILPLALLVMGLAAVAILVTMGRPILFRQQRPGYLCRPFAMLKLRTMRCEGNSESPKQDAQRLTRLGRFLRKTSIDELPQLFNVLRGEMSLVGPRPQLLAYLPRMTRRDVLRQCTLPGITGASQVAGRNGVSWSDRFDVDLRYVRERGFLGDLGLLLRTIPAVLIAKGISAQKAATMPEMEPVPEESAS